MKAVKWGILSLLVFMLVFNFMPTGNSAQDVTAGFNLTQSYAASQTVFVSANNIDRLAADIEDDALIGSMREAMVQLNIEMATQYGNGFYASSKSEPTVHASQHILYSTSNTADYSSFDKALDSYNALRDGTKSTMNLSCHGSCMMVWGYFWRGAPYFVGTDVPAWILTDEVSTRVHTNEEAYAIAKPGDVIWNTKPNSRFAHSTMYIGTVTIDGVTIENAVRNTGGANNLNDCVIKPLYDITGFPEREYYVLSLSKCMDYVRSHGGTVEAQEWVGDIEMPEGQD